MIKKIWTLLFLFSASISFGQDIILQKNTHPKTKELKHNLNQTRDSLIMSCESTILKVEIFNEDYEKNIIVEATEAHIPLDDLPGGAFVVEVQLATKIVVMHLFNQDSMDDDVENVPSGGHMSGLAREKKTTENASHHSIEFLLSGRKSTEIRQKKQKFYWTLAKVNTGNTSSKTMRLENQKTVDEMISKHKLESKTFHARFNELIIWEVYDKTKFMEQQFANPDYINSSASNLFNVSPYFSSLHNFE